MALSDFMPYGAPELLEGASPRMARSTLVASGLVAMLVWAAGALLASRPQPIPVIELPPDPFRWMPPIQTQPSAPPQPVPVAPYVDPAATPVPVPEAPSTPHTDEPPLPADPTLQPTGDVSQVQPSGPAVPAGCGCEEPLPTDYVYTDELPKLVRSVTPLYPDLARDAGVEGTVKTQLLVGLDGHVLRAIVQPRGSIPMLDEAALAAGLQFVFTPALANGHPVKVWVTQDFRFRLH